MMSIIWYKVWRDLWHSKLRTILVVLSISAGVFALGLVFGLSGVMRDRMTEDHRATNPAHITLWGGPFDEESVEAVLREPGIADVEATIGGVPFRWKLEGETEWRDGALRARADYQAQRLGLLDLMEGHWPEERTLAVERRSSSYFDVPLGTTIVVEFGRGERRLLVGGIVRQADIFPPQFGGRAAFYATPETVAWLTGYEGFDNFYVRLESFSKEGADEAAERIRHRLKRMGVRVGGHRITDPDVHWMQDMADTMFLILGILGGLALGLSAFLIINTTNAIVAQQVWQIGVMKAVGATFGRVVRVYLAMALVYGLLSLVLAVPLGAVAAHLLAGWLLEFLNIDSGTFRLIPVAVGIQMAVGLVVPVLAALVPVLGGARISPRQAISSYGLGGGFGRGWLDRLIGRIRFLSRPLVLSLRNTFRRKARVALTLLALTFGGVMFIMVMSLGDSLNNTFEGLLDDLGFDILGIFARPYRVACLLEVAEGISGVMRAEVWEWEGAMLSLAGGEQRQVFLWGVPPDSEILKPRIVSGRNFLPEDGRAILLNSKIGSDEGIQVGDQITLTIGDRESVWTVVGLIFNVNNQQRDCFVPFDALAREIGTVNLGTMVMMLSEQDDAESQQRLIRNLRAAYTARGIEPPRLESAAEFREQNRAQFNILIYLMLTMVILAAVVGSIGLMGTMSINVVERAREIGVMRAIGATSSAIAGIFVGEGVLLGVLSWLFAVPLSYPGARAFSDLVGGTLMRLPLDFSYSVSALVLWLAVVVVLSAVASLWPALRATKVSVREALAYE